MVKSLSVSGKRDDIEDILQDPQLRHFFQGFLESLYCGEMMRFYLAVEEFKSGTADDRRELAPKIFERFFSTSSSDEINVSATVHRNTRELVAKSPESPKVFDAAEEHVVNTMRSDSLPKFAVTHFFKEYTTVRRELAEAEATVEEYQSLVDNLRLQIHRAQSRANVAQQSVVVLQQRLNDIVKEQSTMPRKLHIQVRKARDLAAKDSTGFSDPYIVFSVKDEMVVTKTIEQDLNPVWNEYHCVEVVPDATRMTINVWDRDAFGSDFLGRAFVELDEIEGLAPEKRWIKLAQRKEKEFVSGEVLLVLHLVQDVDSKSAFERALSHIDKLLRVENDALGSSVESARTGQTSTSVSSSKRRRKNLMKKRKEVETLLKKLPS